MGVAVEVGILVKLVILDTVKHPKVLFILGGWQGSTGDNRELQLD